MRLASNMAASFSAEVGGKRVEEGLWNHAWGVDFISGRDVGAGKNGVGLEMWESNAGQHELSRAKYGFHL